MPKMPRILLPQLAVAGFAFASWTAFSAPQQPASAPPVEPSRAPYPTTVSGAGLVEPAAERTTAIGTPFAGLVLEVRHGPGAKVRRGETLGPDVSILKIWAMELYQRISELLLEAADENAMFEGTVDFDGEGVDVLSPFYMSRPGTIYGGSNEIQRNIVAKDVLRLPAK